MFLRSGIAITSGSRIWPTPWPPRSAFHGFPTAHISHRMFLLERQPVSRLRGSTCCDISLCFLRQLLVSTAWCKDSKFRTPATLHRRCDLTVFAHWEILGIVREHLNADVI